MENKQFEASKDTKVAKEFWKGLADYYVDITNMHNLSSRATVENFIKHLNLKNNSKVLDAGCGHLRISFGLLKVLPEVKITGVDFTQELLDQGKAHCEKNNIDIDLYCADIKKLPFQDDSFDAVMSARVFQYIEDPVAALKELRRVVKKGGRVVVGAPNKLNLVKQVTYKGALMSPGQLAQNFSKAGLKDIKAGSMCFVPGKLSWNSVFRHAEFLSSVFPFSKMGGNVVVSGVK